MQPNQNPKKPKEDQPKTGSSGNPVAPESKDAKSVTAYDSYGLMGSQQKKTTREPLKINLTSCGLSDSDIEKLMQTLSVAGPRPLCVDLSKNKFSEQGILTVVTHAAVTHPNIKELTINNNNSDDDASKTKPSQSPKQAPA